MRQDTKKKDVRKVHQYMWQSLHYIVPYWIDWKIAVVFLIVIHYYRQLNIHLKFVCCVLFQFLFFFHRVR